MFSIEFLLDQRFHIPSVWSLTVEYFWGIQRETHNLLKKSGWKLCQSYDSNLFELSKFFVNLLPRFQLSLIYDQCSLIRHNTILNIGKGINKFWVGIFTSQGHIESPKQHVSESVTTPAKMIGPRLTDYELHEGQQHVCFTSQRWAYSRLVRPAPYLDSGSVSRGRKRFHRPAALASCCSCWCLAGMVQSSSS